MSTRIWVGRGLAFAGWTFLGLFFASQTYLTWRYTGGEANWRLILEYSLAQWYLWGFFAAFVVRLTRRFPIERPHLATRLPLHIAASLLVVLLKLASDMAVAHLAFGLQRPVGASLHLNFLTYWAIVGLTQSVGYYRRYRDRESRSFQLESLLAQSRLQALRGQIHPHFLFNTLQAISTLLYRDAAAADQMLIRLSHLLRASLEGSSRQKVPLVQELDFLKSYLEIEQVRLRERLKFRFQVTNETLEALVPYLILLPLVENAVRHGIAPRARPGEVCIRACLKNAALLLEVEDDGLGMSRSSEPGIGLTNTKAILEQLYGSAHRLEVLQGSAGGLIVRVAIPLELATGEGPAEVAIEDARAHIG